LQNHTFRLPDASEWAPEGGYPEGDPRPNYTTSTGATELFLDRYALWREAYHAQLPPELIGSNGTIQEPGGQAGSSHRAGNATFGVYYDYALSWSSPNLDPELLAQSMCEVFDLEASGSLTAGGKAFGSPEIPIIDASVGASLLGGPSGDLTILGAQIWGLQPSEEWLVSNGWERSEDLLEGTIRFNLAGFIPMRITGGIAGTLGMEYGLTLDAESPCIDDDGVAGCQDEVDRCARLGLFFHPSARLDGFAEVAVDFVVASAGIRCDLTLVRVDVPFDVTADLVPSSADWGQLKLTSDADLELRALDGTISVFAEVILLGRYTEPVFSWAGVKQRRPLFNSEYTVGLGTLLDLL